MDTGTSELAELMDAVTAERAIERGSRGKPWDDDSVWPVYLRAVERRRRAVDAWLALNLSLVDANGETAEAVPVSMALV